MMRGWFRFLPWVLLVLVMSGCGAGGGDDHLHQWVAEQRRKAVPRVTPVSEPKRYVPLAYDSAGGDDPFSFDRLTKAMIDPNKRGQGALIYEEQCNRRKEPLEAFPLDSMAMVGSLQRAGKRVALVKVDKLLHQVQEGNYLGQNCGKVMQISEQEVTLKEVVQDATGEWIDRTTTLQLQEKAK
jgi:type IV pilus assembly protein PilP